MDSSRRVASLRARSASRPRVAAGPVRRAIHRGARTRAALLATDAVLTAITLLLASRDAAPGWTCAGVLLVLVVVKVAGLYDRDTAVMRRSTLDELPRVVTVTGLSIFLLWLALPGFAPEEPRRLSVVGLWVALAAVLLVGRMLTRAALRAFIAPEHCLVVGAPLTASRLVEKLEAARPMVSVVRSLPAGAPELESVEAIEALRREEGIERLIVAPPHDAPVDRTPELVRMAKAARMRISLVPTLAEVVGGRVEFEDVEGMAMLGVRPFGLSRSAQHAKRVLDVVGATVGLVAAAPLLAALMALVKLDSPGPVLFRQPRVGRDGEHFDMLKLRSMVVDAEARKAALIAANETEGLFKIASDPRVTRVGRVLRRTSLDELPQLLNVLRGEMSLVGPRPLVLDEDALIGGLDRARLHLKPGMTGPWQILGPARVPLREMLAIDYVYVANWSLWRDVEILIRTAAHMLRGGGM